MSIENDNTTPDSSGQNEAPVSASGPRRGAEASTVGDGQKSDRTEMTQAFGWVSFRTLLSRLLGLWRDRLMGAIFGATGINDAFQIAFMLPQVTRRLLSEGTLDAAVAPVLSERLATGRKEAASRTASVLLTRLGSGLLLVCMLLIGLSLLLRMFMRLPSEVDLTLKLSELMLFCCVCINAAAILMGVLNALRHFKAPAAAPLLLNVSMSVAPLLLNGCMIVACQWGLGLLGETKADEVTVMAIAVLVGGVLQLLIMAPSALRGGFRYRPSLDKADDGYREAMQGFAPAIVGVALFQVNVLIDKLSAWVLIPESGPVTMLAYGDSLIQLPWAVFSLALATTAWPLLARYWAEEKKEEFREAMGQTVRNTLFLAAPSSVGMYLLSTDLVRLLYGSGEFLRNDGDAVLRTGRVVALFSLGLCFYSLNAILARALYATKDTRSPTRAVVYAVVVNVILNLALVLGTDLKEAGLALASAISGAVQTLFLLRAWQQKTARPDYGRLISFITMVGGSAVVGVIAAWLVYQKCSGNETMEGFLTFLFAAMAVLIPLYLFGRLFFARQLKELGLDAKAANRENGQEVEWPSDLLMYHSIFTTTLACMIMGLMVWAVRDSLPPGENSFALVFQRGVVPVAAGVAVFIVAAGSVQSRDYEELKVACAKRLKKAKS